MSIYSGDDHSLIDEQHEHSQLAGLMPPLTPDSLQSSASSTQSPIRSFNPIIGHKNPWAPSTADRLPPSPLISNVMTNDDGNAAPHLGVSPRRRMQPELSVSAMPPYASRFFPPQAPQAGHGSPWNSIPNVLVSNTARTTGISPLTPADAVFDPMWDQFQDLRLLNREKHAFAEVCKVIVNNASRTLPEREQDLLARLEDRNWQLQRYREQERMFKQQERHLDKRIADFEQVRIDAQHVVVLVDASTQAFNEELLQQGEEGGRRSGEALLATVISVLRGGIFESLPPEKITIRAYADQSAFANHLPMQDFARGFNAVGDQVDFVDCKHFRSKFITNCALALADGRCAQLFIAGIGDDATGDSLHTGIHSDSAISRTVLLLDIDQLFQVGWQKYTKHRINYLFSKSRAVPTTPRPSTAAPAATWASRAAKAAPLQDTSNQPSKPQPTRTPAMKNPETPANKAVPGTYPPSSPSTSSAILVNSHGQRIDPLVTHNKDEVVRIKKLKLCNAHFLRHFCRSGSSCYHDHTYKITPAELKTLEHVARMAPCEQGSECDDEGCYHGHVCPAPKGRKGELCIFGDSCRFPDEMHNVERK